MKKNMCIEKIEKIQRRWRSRFTLKKEMLEYFDYIYLREQADTRIFNLIDESLDDHIHFIIHLYDSKMKRLKMSSYDDLCFLHEISD